MSYQPLANMQNKKRNDNHCYFEILATDTTGKVIIKNEDSFCYNLISNNSIWSSPVIKPDHYIVDDNNGLRLHVQKINTQNDSSDSERKQVYVITVNGEFDKLEPFRVPLLSYLKTLNFDSLYVLEDHISQKIADQIYPGIYKVESFLRKYVIKFFAIKLGPEWWDLTADSEMQKKTNQRKNNETIFSEYIDNKVYLIDFGELGKLIYSQSSGNLNKDDIINKIMKLEDTFDAIKKFKEEIQTNYNKFFKSTFKENNFQSNWEELEKIRHKIAHNNLFVIEDQRRSQILIAELIKTITRANEEIDELSFSEEDKEDIMRSFIDFKTITRDVFLEELRRSIKWAKESADGFVGLQNFLVNILGSKGYEFQATRDLVKELEAADVVEVYTHNSEKNERCVAAIRFKNEK